MKYKFIKLPTSQVVVLAATSANNNIAKSVQDF
jgi:hypothetical protein